MNNKQPKSNLTRGIDHIGVGCVALVHDGKGNLLLQMRGEQARDERGAWDLCGGAIEFGDTLDETLRKELMEELCVESLATEFLVAYDAHRLQNGIKTHWVQFVYAVKVDPTKVKIGEPHKISQLGWFTSKDLPAPLHSQFQKSYQVALQRGIVN